jgi:hypothetical protein
MAEDLSWAQIENLIKSMFSSDYGGISYKTQSFYGNDAVCLFKYFVTKEDPQAIFAVLLLCSDLLCFIIISVSYGAIVIKSKTSAKQVAIDKAAKKINSNANSKLKKIQRVTFWIIFTDFACLVPFIVACSFHYLGILDATPLYSFFSILALPINSVINPLIYNATVRQYSYSTYCKVRKGLNELLSLTQFVKTKVGDSPVIIVQQEIELREIAPTLEQPRQASNPYEEIQKEQIVVKLKVDAHNSFPQETPLPQPRLSQS